MRTPEELERLAREAGKTGAFIPMSREELVALSEYLEAKRRAEETKSKERELENQ